MIDCKHWSKCGSGDGGCCSLGLFGGRPSYGTCRNVCEKGPGKKEKERPAARTFIGTRLKEIIKRDYHVEPGASCGCDSLASDLNTMTTEEALEKEAEILDQIVLNAIESAPGKYRWVLRLPGGKSLGRSEAKRLFREAVEVESKRLKKGAGNGSNS